MELGLAVSEFTWPGGDLALGPTFARIARDADAAGFGSLLVMDHFFQIGRHGAPEDEMLESTSALAFAAGVTERIKLGAKVTGVTYRHPGLLIKSVTTLDVLSGGRAIFGIGAAWNEQEHRGLGAPFPPLRERFERLEETLQIAHQMWNGDASPYKGRHYQLDRPLNSPNSLQRPRPRIMIGGSGERKTLRLVAQYADACNLFDAPGLDELRHKLDVLREHCAEVGRPYDEITRTVASDIPRLLLESDGRIVPSRAIERFAQLADLGIDEIYVTLPEVWNPSAIDLFAREIIPAVAAIVPAGRARPALTA